MCKTCNLDPLNKLTEEIRAEAAGQVPSGSSVALLDSIGRETALARLAAAHAFGQPIPTRTSARPAGTSRSPLQKGSTVQFVIDMEVTNRCNAKCHFCPRDRTPHQGLMPAGLRGGLQRAIEYRSAIAEPAGDTVRVSLCGLGEPLLNRRAVDYCRQARAEGFSVVMSSNGSLLDERRSPELLEAGLQQILVNVGEEGDDYEEIYQLPFERTLENVVRFNEMSGGACEVVVVLVDHRGDPAHRPHAPVLGRPRDPAGRQLRDHEPGRVPVRRPHAVRDYPSSPRPAPGSPPVWASSAAPSDTCSSGTTASTTCAAPTGRSRPRSAACSTSRSSTSPRPSSTWSSPATRVPHLQPGPDQPSHRGAGAEAGEELPPGSAHAVVAKIAADNGVVEGVLRQLGLEVPAAPPTRRLIPVRAV